MVRKIPVTILGTIEYEDIYNILNIEFHVGCGLPLKLLKLSFITAVWLCDTVNPLTGIEYTQYNSINLSKPYRIDYKRDYYV